MAKRSWKVSSGDTGMTLDKFLAAPDRLGSRSKAAQARVRGKVFVNDREAGPAHAGLRLSPGDAVRVWEDRPGSARRRAFPFKAGDLDILYEDQFLIVLNKPAGLLAVPLERREEATSIYDQIEDHLRSHGKRKVFVVHRIDRDTSGIVLFAKDGRTQAALKRQFRERSPERVYLAVVYGHPKPSAGIWRDHLAWDPKALIQKETHPKDPQAAEAISSYRVIETFPPTSTLGPTLPAGPKGPALRTSSAAPRSSSVVPTFRSAVPETSLIEVRLKTGKRNQIRIQARLRGHTLVGEVRYTYGPDELRQIPFKRQALHAWRLSFRHPVEDKMMKFEAPLPEDMTKLIATLRRRV
jgi:23S rRNA pseudouridine1911/1915/1917 synthase